MGYIRLIPKEMKDIIEYQKLAGTGDVETNLVKEKMTEVSNNHVMSTLNEYGCSRLEKIMEITGTDGLTVEARRLLIIAKSNNTLPYTIYNLKTKVRTLLGNDGFDMTMNYQTYILTIYIYIQNQEKLSYVKENIEGIIPANIDLRLQVRYNNYNFFKKYTYNELKEKGWTYKYMKEHYFEEALNDKNRKRA